MNARAPLCLGGLTALLLVLCLADLWFGSGDEKSTAQTRSVFPGLKADDITKLQVQHGEVTLRATRKGSSWRLTNPEYPAQSSRIEQLVEALEQLVVVASIPETEWTETGNPVTFGLDPVVATLGWETNGKRGQLDVGATVLFNRQGYARRPGKSEALLVNAPLEKLIPKNADDWRDARFIEFEELEFDRLTLWSGRRTVTLQRGEKKTDWRMVEPVDYHVDPFMARELFQRIQLTRVKGVVNPSTNAMPENLGLKKAVATIDFFEGETERLSVRLGNSPDEGESVYAFQSRRGTLLIDARKLLPLLQMSHDQYRDRRLLRHPTKEIHSIAVEGSESFQIQKQHDDSWQVNQPNQFPADKLLVENLLQTAANLRVKEFVQDKAGDSHLAQFSLNKPSWSLRLEGGSEDPNYEWSNRFGLGKIKDGVIFARVNDEHTVLSVPESQTLLLPRRAFQLRERKIWSFNTNQIASVAIATRDRKVKLERNAEGKWTGPGLRLDAIQNAILEEILYQLGNLTVENWIAQGREQLGIFAIKDGEHQLTLEIDSEGKRFHRTLDIGKHSPLGRRYAATELEGIPTVFEMSARITGLYQNFLPALSIPLPQ